VWALKKRTPNEFRDDFILKRRTEMKEKKTSECIGAMIGGIIGLIVVNSVPLWAHLTNGIILESWTKILWAANL
jgi:hypothetical protein